MPVRLPAIPESLTKPNAADPPRLRLELDALTDAYYALARGQLGELQKRLLDAAEVTPGGPPGSAALWMQPSILWDAWDSWYKRTKGVPQTASGWSQGISDLLLNSNRLESAVSMVITEPPGQGPARLEALTEAQLAAVADAVKQTTVLPQILASTSVDAVIGSVFSTGQVAEIRSRMNLICKSLDYFLAHTKAGTAGQSERFVLDLSLTDSMPVVASGSGPGAYIRINPGSLSSFTSRKLAISLIHEGSHTLADNPTVDFAYRKGGALYTVPAKLRVRNAAQYEHLAASFIDPSDKVPDFPGTPEAFAIAMLQAKLTRAWVRANDLKAGSGPAHKTFVSLFGFDPDKIGTELYLALAFGLYDVINYAMRMAVNDAAILRRGPAPGLTVVSGAAQLTVADGSSPAVMARDAIILICRWLREARLTALPENLLVEYIDNIVAYDRPALQQELAAFYQALDPAPAS
jgi:hypothetical protein